jgi:hypothetical protein
MTMIEHAVRDGAATTVPWTTRQHAPSSDGEPGLVAGITTDGVLTWTIPGVDRVDSISLPDGADPVLALLAPALAVARTAYEQWSAGPAVPAVLRVRPYDTVGFFLHQLVQHHHPAVPVHAATRGPIAARIAAAFGATLEDGAADQRAARMPSAPQVRTALEFIAEHAWRIAPAVTVALSEREWLDAVASGELEHGLTAVVHP